MRGISEEELRDLHDIAVRCKDLMRAQLLTDVIHECQELQEPWMTLEEFLNKPKYEWCWIMLADKQIHMSYVSYNESENYVFYCNDSDRDDSYSLTQITHVIPIHKPEPPR